MKLKIILLFSLFLALCRINNLLDENKRLNSNQGILLTEKSRAMTEGQKYKVADSLNAIKVSELQLTLNEYKKYRANDLKLIKRLKEKKSEPQKIIDMQTETAQTIIAAVDSASSQNDTLRHFEYTSEWTDITGLMDLRRDTVKLQIKHRESLIIINTITRKRFLGFLWKTKKIKDQKTHAVSRNPGTEILNCECISIIK